MAASDVHLDRIGRLVGEARQGRSDAVYASAIKVRIKVNRSDTSAETLLQIAALLVDPATIVYSEGDVASYRLSAEANTGVITTLAKALRQVDAAGVGSDLSFAPSGSNVIRFGSVYGAAPLENARGSVYTPSDDKVAGYSP